MQLYLKPNPQTRVSNIHPEKQNVQALQPISTGGNSCTFTGVSDPFSSPGSETSVWDSSMLVLLVCTCRWMLPESKLANSIVSVPCRVRWMAEDASEFMSLWNYRQDLSEQWGDGDVGKLQWRWRIFSDSADRVGWSKYRIDVPVSRIWYPA